MTQQTDDWEQSPESQDRDDWFNPGSDDAYQENVSQNGHNPGSDNERDFSKLFDGPNFSDFVKTPKTATAREYEKKVKALLKAGVFQSVNSGNYADAATLIYYGTSFSAAAGEVANTNELTRKTIDFLTTPSNPYAMFVVAALPMVAQLLRNRENTFQSMPEMRKLAKAERKAKKEARKQQPRRPWFKIRLLGREFGVGVRVRVPFSGVFTQVKSQTHEPGSLVFQVFSDEKVIKELNKQGLMIKIQKQP